MRDAIGLAFVGLIVYAVLSLGATAWDAEASAREAIDSCLAFGGTPSQCVEMVQP